MALKLPRLTNIDVTDGTARPATVFIRFWDQFATAIEGAIASILSLTTAVGDATAQGLFSVTQGTTSAGALATILLQVRAVTGGVLKAASIKISALAVGSRIEITADDIWLNGNVLSSGAIDTTMIGAAAVGGTQIAGAAVATTHLAANAATDADSVPFSGLASFADTTFRDCGSVTRTWSGGKAQLDFTVSVDNNDAGDHKINFRVQKDGVTQKNFPNVAGRGYICPKTNELSVTLPYDDTPSAASHTYNFQYACVAGDLTANLTLDGALRWSDIKR